MSYRITRTLLIPGLALMLLLALSACGGAAQPTAAPTEPEAAPTCPAPIPCPTPEPTANVPFLAAWEASAHADAEAAAFTHWNEEDPQEIPVECAKCHSSSGFQDFVGADGSEAMRVEGAHAIGSVITCETCHNAGTAKLTSVIFPSGAEITGLGREAVCMTCHQGAASKVQVDEAIAKVAPADDDTPVEDLGFTNVHYFAAAVSRYGTLVKGGYEFDGKTYDGLFEHAAGIEACQDCHDSHSLEVKVESCTSCHEGVATVEDLRAIRMPSSLTDYDGDGDVKEGVADEITGLRDLLYTAIQAYATDVAGAPIVYSTDAYPYFFNDTNADGKTDEAEAAYANAYKSWTARLAKAAYNYQVSVKDPGAYAHGGKYVIELLYDSIEVLNEKLDAPVDLATANRTDAGHFDGSAMAFRDWDADGKVPNSCVKCHTSGGLPQLLAEGVNTSAAPSNGLTCETCHNDLSTYSFYEIETVTFPSGAKLGFVDSPQDNLCLSCHQGRESTVSVNRAIGEIPDDTVDESLSFRNVHYFAAGATLFGTDAKGVYEYKGKEYLGQFQHVPGVNTCSSCHDAHMLQPQTDACQGCHQVEDPELIRGESSTADFDGDGDVTEGIKGEVDTEMEILYAGIQAYAKTVLQKPIAYSPAAYPYFFNDLNDNGQVDPDEANRDNRYMSWTPRLLRAAYNYQYAQKDPGAFVHNGKYILQVLTDSIKDLTTRVAVEGAAKLVRP